MHRSVKTNVTTLAGRTQHVRRGETSFAVIRLVCGVPQRSVLGSILFIMVAVCAIENDHYNSRMFFFLSQPADVVRSSSLLAFKNSLKNIDLTYILFGKM